jgi:ferritin-like metal-binding protein YciE
MCKLRKEQIKKDKVIKMLQEILEQEKIMSTKIDNYTKVGNAVFSTTIMNIAFKYGIKDI